VNRRADQEISNHRATPIRWRWFKFEDVSKPVKVLVAEMRMTIILPMPIAPNAQNLLQDEEGDKAGEQQPGKLTSGADLLNRLWEQVTKCRAQKGSGGQAYQKWNNPRKTMRA
jgi:hypothetical protein